MGRPNPSLVRRIGLGLAIVGVLLVGAAVAARINYEHALRLQAQLVASQVAGGANGATPVHLTIRMYVDLPLEPQIVKDNEPTVSEHAGSFISGGKYPGGGGNVILYGHNHDELFGKITKVPVGTEVTVRTAVGEHHYRVTEVTEVGTGDDRLLRPTDHDVVTIYTCTGFLDRHRFILRAEPTVG